MLGQMESGNGRWKRVIEVGVGVYLLRLVGSEVLTEILELIGEYVVRDERALDVGAGGMYMCV